MRKVLFHHIPKTAGTSLISNARLLFGDRVHDGRYDDQVSDDAIRDEAFVFYHGHFTRGFVLRFRALVPDATIFTFVRHPFERTLSQYYNWTDRKRVGRELDVVASASGETNALRQLRAKFKNKIFEMSLEQFLRSRDPDILQAVDNLQSQYMTLVDSKPSRARFHAAACNALSFYDFIGIHEFYEPCLRILEARCDLPANCLGGGTRENASDYAKYDGRYRVTANAMEWLERRNVYDLALYHACYALLLKQYGDWLPPDALDIDKFVTLPDVVSNEISTSLIAHNSDRLAPFVPHRTC